jgi:hypothetical protein
MKIIKFLPSIGTIYGEAQRVKKSYVSKKPIFCACEFCSALLEILLRRLILNWRKLCVTVNKIHAEKYNGMLRKLKRESEKQGPI